MLPCEYTVSMVMCNGQGVESSERESQQYGSDTSGANNAPAVGGGQRRRKRSAATFDPYGGGFGGYYPGETEEHLTVPKRLRTTARDAQLWRGGSSAVEASPSPRQASPHFPAF